MCIPPGTVHRGHGGVAVIWKEELHPYMKPMQEGNKRILPVTLKCGTMPILLICCYLPSGNSKTALEKYSEDMAMLNELLIKYIPSHHIVIAGDLNVDIFHRQGKKESLLISLMQDFSLTTLNHSIKDVHTYLNPAIAHASHLDYFLVDDKLDWTQTEAIGKDTLLGSVNSSTHIPIQTRTQVQMVIHNREKPQGNTQKAKKMKWECDNIWKYQDCLELELSKTDFNNMSTEEAMSAFTSAISKASSATMGRGRHRKMKRKKYLWSTEIQEASMKSKHAFWKWKTEGRPGLPHPLAIAKNRAKKMLRSTQRLAEAVRRDEYMRDIMQASSTDSKLFHRLVKNNRSTDSADLVLRESTTSNDLVTDCTAQLDLWFSYFRDLSTQSGINEDEESTLLLMRDYNAKQNDHFTFSTTEVETSIRRLNSGKAADQDGITAEHLKHANAEAYVILTDIVNRVLQEAKLPAACKSGFKIPLPKKGKDSQLQTNYRGITITAVIGKIVEQLIQKEIESLLKKPTSNLQFGFTPGLSPIMASLCLSEAIASSKKERKQLYVTALDAQKAFDVVVHSKLKAKLHAAGIQGKTWSLIDNLYTDVTECVRWKGRFTDSFPVQKGVRQGAVLSTTLYKLYINDLLQNLSSNDFGLKIGTIYMGTPTCADDQLLLSDSHEEMQAMINSCHIYSEQHQYTLHPVKSTVTPYLNIPAATKDYQWKIGDDDMQTTPTFTHLGLIWKEGKSNPDIESRIKTARRTVYALMGTGLHGTNGLSPAVSAHIIKIYVIPRLLYGLEAGILSKKQREDLGMYHKNLLRRIQGLPRSTATEAIYLLLGELPIDAEIDIRILTLYGAICRAEDNKTLRNLASRQLCLENKYSWFQEIIHIAFKYNINLSHTIEAPWRKNAWKDYVTDAVKTYWLKQLLESAAEKSSTKWMDLSNAINHNPHPMWIACKKSPRMVPAAVTRARLLTATYPVQQRLNKIKNGSESKLCPLCHMVPEDIHHFVLKCPKTEHIRSARLDKLRDINTEWKHYSNFTVAEFLNGPKLSYYSDSSITANAIISELCHRLHNYRSFYLQKDFIYPITQGCS